MNEPEKKTSETSGSTGLSDSNSEEIQGDEYPTQHHAGKVGLGPQYHKGESMIDKVKGLTHKLVGKGKDDEHEIRSDQDQGFGELGLGNTGSQEDGIKEEMGSEGVDHHHKLE